jgi:hypothetical protein
VGSFGTSTGNYGVYDTIMQNCYGSSSSTFGLQGFIGSDSSGSTLNVTHNDNSF